MTTGEGGWYSNIFEQHRLSLLFGLTFKSIFFGSGDFLIFASGMNKKPKK